MNIFQTGSVHDLLSFGHGLSASELDRYSEDFFQRGIDVSKFTPLTRPVPGSKEVFAKYSYEYDSAINGSLRKEILITLNTQALASWYLLTEKVYSGFIKLPIGGIPEETKIYKAFFFTEPSPINIDQIGFIDHEFDGENGAEVESELINQYRNGNFHGRCQVSLNPLKYLWCDNGVCHSSYNEINKGMNEYSAT